MKRQDSYWENIFAKYISDKGAVSIIQNLRKLSNLTMGKTAIAPVKIYECQTITRKDFQHHWSLGKFELKPPFRYLMAKDKH